MVYVRLRSYHQISVRPHYSKLSKHFYGLFPVLEKVGLVAYSLQLPAESKIHPAFHVSLFKPHKGPSLATIDTIPPLQLDNHRVVEPLSLLDWKWNHATTPPSQILLVQWKRFALEETSWENWATLQSNTTTKKLFLRRIIYYG